MWLKKGSALLFGAIEYLNLLPFKVFLKKYIKNSAIHTGIQRHKNVPSKINQAFHKRAVNSAFISSVTSKNCRCTNAGIVAKKRVYSVLLKEGIVKDDAASQTSNALAKILNLHGEVIIGDRALKAYLDGGEYKDLAYEWYKKRKLPFVFARLCYHEKKDFMEKLSKDFIQSKIKIPQYILKNEAKRRDINPKDVRWYLEHIDYTIDAKAKKSLNIFLQKTKKI